MLFFSRYTPEEDLEYLKDRASSYRTYELVSFRVESSAFHKTSEFTPSGTCVRSAMHPDTVTGNGCGSISKESACYEELVPATWLDTSDMGRF